MKQLKMLRDGEQLVIQADEGGCLVALRDREIVATSEHPGALLRVVLKRHGGTLGTVEGAAPGLPGHVNVTLS